jgi:hypothetical protein
VGSFTHRPLEFVGKISRYLLDRRLDGPQNRSELCGEERNLAQPGIEPGPSSPLYRLSCPDSLAYIREDIATSGALLNELEIARIFKKCPHFVVSEDLL